MLLVLNIILYIYIIRNAFEANHYRRITELNIISKLKKEWKEEFKSKI